MTRDDDDATDPPGAPKPQTAGPRPRFGIRAMSMRVRADLDTLDLELRSRRAKVSPDERRQVGRLVLADLLDELAETTRLGAEPPEPLDDPKQRAELFASAASALRDLVFDVETAGDPLARTFGLGRRKLDPKR